MAADHGKLKRLINPVRGLNWMKTAYATIKGFELMRMFKNGQLDIWKLGQGLTGRAIRYLQDVINKIKHKVSGLSFFCNRARKRNNNKCNHA